MFTESHVFSRIRDNIHETVTKHTHINDEISNWKEIKSNWKEIKSIIIKVIFLNRFQKSALYYKRFSEMSRLTKKYRRSTQNAR